MREGDRHRSGRYYSFVLDQQSSVTIELTTTADINTRLQLRRGGDNRDGWSSGQAKGRKDTAARIALDLPVGDYTIDASPFHSFDRGTFALKVEGVSALVASGSQISVAAAGDVTEGGDAVFTVSASPPPSAPLTVWLRVTTEGAFGVTQGYQREGVSGVRLGLNPVTVSTAGSGSLTVTTVDDSADEADGSVTATVDASPRYSVSSSAGSATVTVSDDEDPLPPPVTGDDCVAALTGDGSFEAEWDAACTSVHHSGHESRFYTFTLAGSSTVKIDLASKCCKEGQLYLRSGSGQKDGTWLARVVPPSCSWCPYIQTSRMSRSLPAGDYTIEAVPRYSYGTGPFTLTVSGVSAVSTEQTLPVVSIVPIGISALGDDVVVTEGSFARFAVSASPAPSADLEVALTVAAAGDFGVSTGAWTVKIPATGSAALWVATVDDDVDEADGSVTASLDAPAADAGYTVSATANSVTVVVADDDDSGGENDGGSDDGGSEDPPAGHVVDAAVVAKVEALAGQVHHGAVHVNRWRRVLVAFGAHDGTSVTGGAMTAAQAQQMADAHSSPVWDEVVTELTKLEAAAADEDASPTPVLSVAAGSGITEGGTASFTITAAPAPAPASPITVKVAVSESGSFGASGAATVTVSGASTTYTVSTSDDQAEEADGSVTVTLQDGSGYTVSSSAGSAKVAVADDDDPPAGYVVDAGVVSRVRALAGQVQHGSAHVNRWRRVLVAFGEHDGTGVSGGAMTAAQAQQMADAHSSPVWDEVVAELTKLEAAAADEDASPTPVVSVAAGSGITEGGTASFTITASPAPTAPITVKVGVSESGSFGASGAATVTVSGASTTYTVSTTDDSTDEADGSVTATLKDGSGYTVSATKGSATVTVADNDDPPAVTPVVSIAAGSGVTEGGTASFTITATPAPAAPITVKIGVSESGSFGASGAATVTVSGGTTTYTVTTSDDSADEADGSVTVTLKDGSGYTVSATKGAATVAVADDDDPPVVTPVVSIAAGSGVTEGGTASFTVTASPAPAGPIIVKVAVSESGSFGASGAATVTLSGASATYAVTTSDDSTDEADGSVTATIKGGSGYTVSSTSSAATVSVADNDDPPVVTPELSIAGGGGITEGGTASFTITASPAPASPITVKVAVSESGSFGASGAATVTVSGATTTYTVSTSDDSTDEADGSVTATIKGGSGYTVSAIQGAATVTVADNDDPPPQTPQLGVTVQAASAAEGEMLEFKVVLSRASSESVTVTWNTATAYGVTDDRARRRDDYEDVYSQLVFAPGVTELTGEVWLEDDGEAEGDEHFAVEAFLPGSWFRPDAVGIMTITDN